jgi:RNA polymerase sigma-70 factor (ECF subfamily)
VRGAAEVASRAGSGGGGGTPAHRVVVDGMPGILVVAGGRPVTVMAFSVSGGVITVIRAHSDPDRLAQIVPSWVT